MTTRRRSSRRGLIAYVMGLVMSIGTLVAFVAISPLIRLTGFGRKSMPSTSTGTDSLIGAGGYLEQLFAVVNSFIKIPVALRYEKDLTRALTQVRGRTFLDIGANQGYYCCVLWNNFETLIAVEPAPDNIRVMRRVFRLSGVQPLILPIAVSDRNGFSRLVIQPRSSSYWLDSQETERRLSVPSLRVKTVTLDSLIRRYGEVDLVKVDVEGAEWLVLSGADSNVGLVRRFAIELHDLGRKQELEQWMQARGYSSRWLDHNHLYAWNAKTFPHIVPSQP